MVWFLVSPRTEGHMPVTIGRRELLAALGGAAVSWPRVARTQQTERVRRIGLLMGFQMVGKWLEMLKEVAPSVSRAELMFNPDTSPHYYVYLRSFEAEPRSVAVEVTAAPVRNTAEIEEAIAKLGRDPGRAVIVPPDAFIFVHHQLLIRLAQQHRLPAVYAYRTLVAQGALMSYGPDVYDLFRRSASYVDRILKGAKPSDLPVQQPTKFELAINLKTAKALGLQIPDKLVAIADEVIE